MSSTGAGLSAAVAVSPDQILPLARLNLACYATANYPAFELPPHLALVAAKLEAVERGDIKRLIISMPPRHGKSLLASTYFPAWYHGRHPDHYVIAATYAQDLSNDFGRKVRNAVAAPLHRAIFPESRLSDDSTAVERFEFTAGGAHYSVGRGGAITGRGAHLLLLDDMLKDDEEARSATIRRNLQSWFGSVAFTRLMPGGAVVLIANRWHADDLAGWLLREHSAEGWEVVSIPAVAEGNDLLGRAEGEALWPERYPLDVLQSIRRTLGATQFSALYQQRPIPAEGGTFKAEWWQRYSTPPESFVRVVLSIDSAFKTGAANDFSAFTIWGETAKDGIYLLHAWRGRVQFPELKAKAMAFAGEWKPSEVLVEDKASGQSLIQELRRDSNLPVIPVKVSSDKESRAAAVTGIIEAGKVFLPIAAGWLDDYLEELSAFPSAPHDDFVDSTTQALTRLVLNRGAAYNAIEFMRLQAEMVKNGPTVRVDRAPPPAISTLSPARCRPGDLVTITGRNLEGVTVDVDGEKVEAETHGCAIVFVAPNHAPGDVRVLVRNEMGFGLSAFMYVP